MINLKRIIIIGVVLPLLMAAGLVGSGTKISADEDNNLNLFIQPTDVTDKQHMGNADVFIGDDNGNLLIGMLGADTLFGMGGDDILVGGAENFQTGLDEDTGLERGSNSDVLLGGPGNDINVWSPGDGSDAFLGGPGSDIMLFGPLIHPNGDKNVAPTITTAQGRDIVIVDIDEKPKFTCEIESFPSNYAYDYLIRFKVDGNLKVTVRVQDTEKVVCPSPNANSLLYADLTSNTPKAFNERPLSDFSNTLLGYIVQAP